LTAALQSQPSAASTNLMWAALQIDMGSTDNVIDSALNHAVATQRPFWGYYHRIRLYLKRNDYASIRVSAESLVDMLKPSMPTNALETKSDPTWANSLMALIRPLYYAPTPDREALSALLDPLVRAAVLPAEADVLWANLQTRSNSSIELIM
jgi:hypothetical protein